MAEAAILRDILDRRVDLYGHFGVEACLQKTESRYDLVFGKATAFERGRDESAQAPLDFGDYVYVSQCFELRELSQILEGPHPTFKLGSYEFTLKDATFRPSGMGRLFSNNILGKWPGELFELRPSSHTNYLNPKALVAHDVLRLFHDQYDGIQQYLKTKVSFNYNNGWIGAMLFVLPDYRIRLREIIGDHQALTIKMDKKESLRDARLHCLVDGAGGRQEICSNIDRAEITLQLQSSIDELDIFRIFITAPADGLIDSYEQTPMHHTGNTRWVRGLRRDDRRNLIDEIAKGEGPNVEFKPFIRIGRGEKKEGEVIRATIAFANTGGGTIFFGVNNLAEIDGIEKELAAFAPTLEPLSAAEQYGRQLRAILNDVTNRSLDLQSTVVQIANHIVLRLDVSELPAREKPVWMLTTNETWIRNGSTNHKPDPDTIRNLFRNDSSILGSVLQPQDWMS